MKSRVVQDLSDLPTYGFGARMTTWWGTLAYCVLEGMGFALAIGAYLYLAYLSPEWPPNLGPPPLLWSSLHAALMLASLWPNRKAEQAARAEDLAAVRLWLVVMLLIGIALLVLRWMEFKAVNVSWDVNAYGSLVWVLLGLHTAHLLTDVADTGVITALMFTRHAQGKRFSDVEDNAFYWYFVVGSWLVLYLLIYWGPRL